MSIEFKHKQAAHCETGAISNLLSHYHLDISEPMAFGLASGITFAYLKMVKINGLPLIAYRMPPRMIIKSLSRRIKGLDIRFHQFKSEAEGMSALNEKLEQDTIVGLQTSVFFLPYFPKEMRFHFNAHNLLVYGREGNNYKISDPIFSHLVETDKDSLTQARFSRGALAPKGMMYYPVNIPESIDFEHLIPKAIRFSGKMNGRWNPIPFAGIKGMKMIAKRIEKLTKDDPRYARLFLGHIVRMQEEIGTGGAGFRFMYAAFLQESAARLNSQELAQYAQEMTRTGDEWREFALLCARMSKQRGDQDFHDIAQQLRQVASQEFELYNQMSGFKLK